MKALLTALLILINLTCIAQKNSDSLYFVTMKSHVISLPAKADDTIYSLPFNNITVLDVRPDTTSIGFLKSNALVFQKSLPVTFKEFINKNYSTTKDSNDLLVLIKEFRITDYAEKKDMSDENVMQWSGGCMLSAELFLKNNDNYHALYKIDSVLTESSEKETIQELVAESFETIFKKSENQILSKMHIGKTTFSFADIQNHINSFTNFPILKNTVLNKGVYRNFAEFKLNNPSIKDYEIQKGKLTDELLIVENGQSFPLQNFWGYCDGQNLFIRSADNLFQLIRKGNTFNVKAIKSITRKYSKSEGHLMDATSVALTGLPVTLFMPDDYAGKPTAFQLNMQNGDLY